MYSQHYGTLPIVRATGGLDDTVENFDEKSGEGSGFKFYDATEDAIYNTVKWAVSVYYEKPSQFRTMINRVMNLDLSWKKSSQHYERAYHCAMINKSYADQGFRPYYW